MSLFKEQPFISYTFIIDERNRLKVKQLLLKAYTNFSFLYLSINMYTQRTPFHMYHK